MKKLIFLFVLFLPCLSYSQDPKDNLLNDSLHKEKIHSMPMDTINTNRQEFLMDTIPNKTEDDADPKRPKVDINKRD